MSVASELHTSLRSMGFWQLLLAIVFLACYSVAGSTLFGGRGRLRAGGVALVAAGGFTALTNPWEHGMLMVAAAIGGLGLFSAIGWVLSTAFHLPRGSVAVDDEVVMPVEPAAEPSIVSAPARAPQHTHIPAA